MPSLKSLDVLKFRWFTGAFCDLNVRSSISELFFILGLLSLILLFVAIMLEGIHSGQIFCLDYFSPFL